MGAVNRVRLPAGEAHRRQAPAAGVGRLGYGIGAEGLPGGWRGPAAPNPAGQLIHDIADTLEALQGRGHRRGVVHEAGGGAEPAEVNAHVGERRLAPEPEQGELLG
jgi:hypothetical protein